VRRFTRLRRSARYQAPANLDREARPRDVEVDCLRRDLPCQTRSLSAPPCGKCGGDEPCRGGGGRRPRKARSCVLAAALQLPDCCGASNLRLCGTIYNEGAKKNSFAVYAKVIPARWAILFTRCQCSRRSSPPAAFPLPRATWASPLRS